MIQTGNLASNNVSVPVATDGGSCTDTATSQLPPSLPAGQSSYTEGIFSVFEMAKYLNGGASVQIGYSASALFEGFTGAGILTLPLPIAGVTTNPVSPGSCSTSIVTRSSATTPLAPEGLDAGQYVMLTGPLQGGVVLTPSAPGQYAAGFVPVFSGALTFSSGPGGTAVGPFSVNVPAPPPLVWNNPGVANTPIDRSKPLTIQWGATEGYVEVALVTTSLPDPINTTQVAAVCAATSSAGQFTIPPSVLLGLGFPPNAPANAGNNYLYIWSFGVQPVSVAGLDYAFTVSESLISVQIGLK